MQPPTEQRRPLQELLAASMDASEALVPHLPALMQDLEDLGARASDVLAILAGRGLRAGSRVLDLGCGKGAAAIAVARKFGASVRGIDGMPEFVEHATARARALGLSERCDFVIGDVRDAALAESGYDLVMLLALGPVFGEVDETIEVLRRCARPGGLVLIDDAYVADGAMVPTDADACYDRGTTLALLEASGDRVVGERCMDSHESETWCRAMTAKIVERATELGRAEPRLARELLEFAERQRRETEVLAGPLVGALWLVEVASGG